MGFLALDCQCLRKCIVLAEHGLELKEKNDIIHGPGLELLQFMEKDVDLMEEIQMDAKEIMKIQTLLEPVVGVLLQVVEGTLEVNLLWNTILMDFLGSQHQLSGPVEKLSQSIGQLELDIKVDTLTDSVRYHQVALVK